jgi:hypothetical protein
MPDPFCDAFGLDVAAKDPFAPFIYNGTGNAIEGMQVSNESSSEGPGRCKSAAAGSH